MRCENCGWENPQGSRKCEKCNSPLINYNQTIIDPGRHAAPFPPTPAPSPAPVPQENKSCERCGYPLSAVNTFCPNCGFSVAPKPSAPKDVEDLKKTVRAIPEALKATVREIPQELIEDTPVQPQPQPLPQPQPVVEVPSFRLVPMDNFDGRTPQALSFSGNSISLAGKDVVDGDSSIPSDLQAVFECEDGVWSVVDNGQNKAVYVCAAHKLQLSKGDIVVIGNRRFIFE